ncbi:unnamed protein product [Trichogramma brassicae]|uniref:Uncharacterized protein n=1 Tax=Trichogramma brassicae TaxID=86971 RepID=A0A6H5I0Q6_9HYME|nr:unnamed protein product [Trichogramma brassicae]
MSIKSSFIDKDFGSCEEPSTLSTDSNERKLARRLRIQRRVEALQKLDGYVDDVVEEHEVTDETLTEKQIQESAELLENLLAEGNEVVNHKCASGQRRARARASPRGSRDSGAALTAPRGQRDRVPRPLRRDKRAMAGDTGLERSARHQRRDGLAARQVRGGAGQEGRHHTRAQGGPAKGRRQVLRGPAQAEGRHQAADRAHREPDHDHGELVRSRAGPRHQDHQERARRPRGELRAQVGRALQAGGGGGGRRGRSQAPAILDDYELEMERLMQEHDEEYRAQKIELEKECQDLQQQLERTKALCLLNAEKLSYNYTVLKSREEENSVVASLQKRKINKLQALLTNLKKNYADFEESTKLEIERLSSQILRAHKSIAELEDKSVHFTRVNEKQYLDIWDMNTHTANELLKKVLHLQRKPMYTLTYKLRTFSLDSRGRSRHLRAHAGHTLGATGQLGIDQGGAAVLSCCRQLHRET